ncbi:MAG: Putative protease inhibitor [Candidatus Tokpelaia hoelldobleri]|uniref:Protease inhibitor n=1 Tax=Candidatus Tokpelaia hoelldobleri TaxID=1902579 RepID=A0A1U9JUJ5_9HYPH|nr:MAG: Putative protease inhibitor [Candidatus Tokpelaia hoelldoblerii]
MIRCKYIAGALIGAGVAFGALTLPVQARDYYDDRGRISWSELTGRLESKGYRIRELEMKDEGWKVEVVDQYGQRLKMRLNRQGEVLREKYKD